VGGIGELVSVGGEGGIGEPVSVGGEGGKIVGTWKVGIKSPYRERVK
jgi:hypothetical protein